MKPNLITLYRCSKCDGYLESKIENIWNDKFEKWKCVKCKREFKLEFRKIKKAKK